MTITGTNFAAGATVTFGGTAATNVVVVNSTTITATTPAGSAGAVTVTVTVSGQSGSLTNGFTYVVAPTVSSVSPNSGPTAGGTAVTITGTNFAAGATVKFGGTAATNVVVVNSDDDHGDDAGGRGGRGDGDGDGKRTERKPDERVHLVGPADGEQCISEQRFGGRWNGGDDHGDELCRGSDGKVRRYGGDQRGGGEQHDDHGHDARVGSAGAVTVTVTVNGQSGSLTNGFTYTGTVAVSFGQVAAATPQSATATVPVTYPAPQTAGDLNIVVVGWNDHDGDSAIGEG